MKQAETLTGLKVELFGAVGKRTRFQQKELSQLVLKVEREEDGAAGDKEEIALVLPDKKLLPNVISSLLSTFR